MKLTILLIDASELIEIFVCTFEYLFKGTTHTEEDIGEDTTGVTRTEYKEEFFSICLR